MDNVQVNGVTYWLPENTADVMGLVNQAIAQNEVICLRGAAHSFPLIGTLEKNAAGRKYRYVMLSKLRKVTIDATNKTVTVEGGCNLGLDPWDPSKISTIENSLLYQLDQQGLAIPDLGGITHQSVGGFLSTASSGGSTTYSFEDAIISIDLVTTENGKATLSSFKRPATFNPDDPFYGVGVASLGVMGIIVSATFQCVDKFFIAGQEATTLVSDCEVDLFGAGNDVKPSMQQFLQKTQYTRLMWWPQPIPSSSITPSANTSPSVASSTPNEGTSSPVNGKMVVWKAWQASENDAILWSHNLLDNPIKENLSLKPYQEVPYIFGTPIISTLAAGMLFGMIGTWPNWLLDMMGDTEEYRSLKAEMERDFYAKILPTILDVFVPLDSANAAQRFSDVWYKGIPMDNQMSDRLFPVWFTELWIPIEQSQQVMNTLQKFYSISPENTGAFSCEIYAAKSNPFWMSPAYQTDVIRIDVFWFAKSNKNPVDFFQKFWQLLQPFSFRPHWGKYLPAAEGQQGVGYLQSLYPKWNQWMQLREKLDPTQTFLNDYWKEHLEIPS